MIALGQRMMSQDDALNFVRIWLETDFEGGRHARRLALLDK
jgi:ribose 5-phosphate isomerase B